MSESRDSIFRFFHSPFIKNSSRSRRGGFANLEANEPANADFVAELPGHAGDMFPDRDFGILLYETLVEQTIRLEEFFELAFHDPGNCRRRAVFDLLRGDFLFLRDDDRVHLIAKEKEIASEQV